MSVLRIYTLLIERDLGAKKLMVKFPTRFFGASVGKRVPKLQSA